MIRLGTSSYIIPADIIPNVDYLKDKVDDVELVLFESREASNIPGPDVIDKLKWYAQKYNLSYTVHLPYDVKAGSADEAERLHALETWTKIVGLTASLPVHGFIVHLEPERYRNDDGTPCLEPARDISAWTRCVVMSMRQLKERTVSIADPSLFCIETLSYDLMPLLPHILENGFSITLDVGHLWLNGLYSSDYVRTLLPHTRIIHLHGVSGLKDHMSLAVHNRLQLSDFMDILKSFSDRDLVLTLEIFSEQDLKESLQVLNELEAF